MSDVVVGGERIPGGARRVVRVPVTFDLTMPVDLHAHVIAGASAGPTLLLLSMLHGNEWLSVVIVREVLKRIDPRSLAGNVIALPVANPGAMLTGTRNVLDDSDEPDANRSFGGVYDWTSNQLTRAIETHFFSIATHLIDYHVSSWGSTMADVSYVADHRDPGVTEKSKAMALAVGFPVLHALNALSGLRGARTSLGYAGEKYKIPGAVVEIGGLGFGEAQEQEWIEKNVEGTLGVMKHLGMLPGAPSPSRRYLHIRDYWRVSPRQGGYVEPVVGLDRQFTEVQKGELLARVTSPVTLQLVEELVSPGRGVLFYMCRSHMARPGGWGFGVAKLEEGKSEWFTHG